MKNNQSLFFSKRQIDTNTKKTEMFMFSFFSN